MNTRTVNDHPDSPSDAAAELKAVLEELDIPVEFTSDPRADLVLPGLLIEVKSAPRPSMAQLRRWRHEARSAGDVERIVVVVADWIDPGLREELRQDAWGWLERSGQLRLVGGGFHVDRQIDPLLSPEVHPPNPLRRESGLAVAIELLEFRARSGASGERPSVRELATAAGLSVGATHKALADLTELALISQDGLAGSALFWAVAREWVVQWFPISRQPDTDVTPTVGQLLRFGLDDLEGSGWAAGGDDAAASSGAPIVAVGPPRLLVPDRRALTWALRTFGEANDERSASAFVAVPPTSAAVRRRTPGVPWPLARSMVIALALASSGPRGRQALQEWSGRPQVLLDD